MCVYHSASVLYVFVCMSMCIYVFVCVCVCVCVHVLCKKVHVGSTSAHVLLWGFLLSSTFI